jgi:hypothetical protein
MDPNREPSPVLSFLFLCTPFFGSVSLVCDFQRMLRRNKSGIKRDQFGLCS